MSDGQQGLLDDLDSSDAEASAPVPSVLDDRAPTIASLYGPEELERDRARQLVRLADLPGGRHSSGWGLTMDRLLGGGITRDFFLAVGAERAAAGKTAFVHQIADGLAARSATLARTKCAGCNAPYADHEHGCGASVHRQPLTPVLWLSEMPVSAMVWRSIGRWVDHDSRVFRAGRGALEAKIPRYDTESTIEAAYRAAREALEGELGAAQSFMRWVRPHSRGASLAAEVGEHAKAWAENLRAEHYGADVWPVVVVDPIQRWADHSVSEIQGLNELVLALRDLATSGVIVLATSDTNATSARGKSEGDRAQAAAAVFRGSYELPHQVDAALVLRKYRAQVGQVGSDEIAAVFAYKNRWGDALPNPRAGAIYRWAPTRARFTPWSDLAHACDGADEGKALAEIDALERGTKGPFSILDDDDGQREGRERTSKGKNSKALAGGGIA